MTTTPDIEGILDFLGEIRKLHHVERFTPQPNGRQENDAEHSWSVAIACALLASRVEKEQGVKLDVAKLIKMALIHDLGEIHTGDTKTWDTAARVGKEERERLAITSLIKPLPDDLRSEMLALWEECEAKETIEAKMVKSIDRFDPVLHRTVFDIGWKGCVEPEHATVESLDARQKPRHLFSDILLKVYEVIRDKAVRKSLFGTDNL